MCLLLLVQSIRNIQHLEKANLLKVKRQQKRDLCATANGLIKSLESVCLNSLRATLPEITHGRIPNKLPQMHKNVTHYHLKENN